MVGGAAMAARARRAGEDYRRKLRGALFRRCEAIMTRSKDEFVPVELGNLKNTGHVSIDPNKLVVTLAYGGPGVDYAVIQHERLDFQHRVGGPKYLERPLMEAAGTLLADVAAEAKLE